MDGLQDAPRSGRPPRADDEYVRLLMQTAGSDPRKMGYAFSRWTAPRLATYLAQKTGVKLSVDRVQRLLRIHKFVWGKSKPTTSNLPDPVEKKTRGAPSENPANHGLQA